LKTSGQPVRCIDQLGVGVQTHGTRERCRETIFVQALYADGIRGHQSSKRVVGQVAYVCLWLTIFARHCASWTA